MPTDYFWTDPQQAADRLFHTYMLYDGKPVFIERVNTEPAEDGKFMIDVIDLFDAGHNRKKLGLDDPLWNRFRDIPPLGWTNCIAYRSAILTERAPLRNKQHGLSNDGVKASAINFHNGDITRRIAEGNWNTRLYFSDGGYIEGLCGQWPTLPVVLGVIIPESTIAISWRYAVMRDYRGLRWLYRGGVGVGLFPSCDQLLLLNKFTYLREELQEAPEFTIETIKEY